MNIAKLQVSFGLEVPEVTTLNIYFTGCLPNKKCARHLCHNKELHEFTYGSDYKLWIPRIKAKLKPIIQGIVFLGGEPLDQDAPDLLDLIEYIEKLNLPIYCYTGYTKEQLDKRKNVDLFKKFTKIYYGEYDPKNKNNKKELVCL